MTVSIITTDGEIRIESTLSDTVIFQPIITVETSDYMIEIANNDNYFVSNACDGWGNNCKELFKDALIEFYK